MKGEDKVKVLQINTLAKTKSTGRNVYEMHKEFQNLGIESKVVASALSKSEEQYGQLIFGNLLDMKFHALYSRATGLQGYYSNYVTKKIIIEIERYMPNAVIVHVIHSNFINVNLLFNYLKSKTDIRTVIVLHDLWFITGHCVHPSITGCEKYIQMCKNCSQKRVANASWFFDTSKKVWMDRKKIFNGWKSLEIVGVSKWATECAKKSGVMQSVQNFTSIYNWINHDMFYNRNNKKKNDKAIFTILGVSVQWIAEKGIYDFIELTSMLENEKLILVGHIDEDIKKKFVNENIEFVEFTNSEDELVELYNQADVYVSMSYQETFGKTIAESICCGTPAVVYDVTACPELVADGCGYAVECGNVKAVYEKIIEIKKIGKVAFAEACETKAINEFNIHKNINQYIELIRKNTNR